MVIVTSLERNVNITIGGNCIFLEKGTDVRALWRRGVCSLADPDAWAMVLSQKRPCIKGTGCIRCVFWWKRSSRHPHLPSGRRQMPFYTRPLLTKNQSARALGIFQRADRPPAFRQRHPDFGGKWQGGAEWGTGRAAPCCAVREGLWVRHRAGCALLCGQEKHIGEV